MLLLSTHISAIVIWHLYVLNHTSWYFTNNTFTYFLFSSNLALGQVQILLNCVIHEGGIQEGPASAKDCTRERADSAARAAQLAMLVLSVFTGSVTASLVMQFCVSVLEIVWKNHTLIPSSLKKWLAFYSCLNYLSFAVVKLHDQGNLQRELLSWHLQFQR